MEFVKKIFFVIIPLMLVFSFSNCQEDDGGNGGMDPTNPDEPADLSDFYFGGDLSYVNQILDHGGIYRQDGTEENPYKIMSDRGTDVARFRLWHNPVWTKEVYDPEGEQLYNDLLDVEKGIMMAKAQGMEVLLDFHYSDVWADPGRQEVPEAWKDIVDLQILRDSVYQYTKKTLEYLSSKNLLPEFVQIGNETNCGMMYSNALPDFPCLNVCEDGNWAALGAVMVSGIQAVREVSASTTIDTKIILHVADPVNVQWWFENIIAQGNVTDFDIVGFSYYPLWHTGVSLSQLSNSVSMFKTNFNKEVMVLETAYPWTTEAADDYNNAFGSETPLSGYPYTQEGQFNLLKDMTQEIIDGGGIGIIYWESAWITSNLKDLWGMGSSWESNTLFDFDGEPTQGMDYMEVEYTE